MKYADPENLSLPPPRCRHLIRSVYCVETRIFDTAYFREKMQGSREGKWQRDQMRRVLLGDERSSPINMISPNISRWAAD